MEWNLLFLRIIIRTITRRHESFTNSMHKVYLFVISYDLRSKHVTNKVEFSLDTIGTFSLYARINIFPLNTE